MKDEKEYIILCDESEKDGTYYSNFYGGVLVGGSDYEGLSRTIRQQMDVLNLGAEVKWSKVTENYLTKYMALMDTFFDLVAASRIKVRIMFSHNANEPIGLTSEDRELGYFKLYYQFLKHAFGISHIASKHASIGIRIYLDEMPDTQEKVRQFKSYLHGLPSTLSHSKTRLQIAPDNVTEIRSHEHVLLQCLDVVLGSMAFRLNDKHKSKPAGQRLRGKRTVAKEKLYKHIRAKICAVLGSDHFNIGDSTGIQQDKANTWHHPYRHWKFQPSKAAYNATRTKGGSQ